MNQTEKRLYLIKRLLDERKLSCQIPSNSSEQFMLLRGLLNERPPMPADNDFLKIQDDYLKYEIEKKGITDSIDIDEACPGISIWQGDITTLKCDAIVNAANSGMTGCYRANHSCIDNCIHTFAGVQLRLECDNIIKNQGHEEYTGTAKITSAYNLPCKYVLHTVGPIIFDKPTKNDCELLKSCYTSCLELADKNGVESIAFCCISTGVFNFPNQKAAEIAVETVKNYLCNAKSIRKVIFNVFKDYDRQIYEKLLKN